MRRAAGRRITVVAGDINDDPAMTGWLRAYKREVRGAKVWALHNFKDATSQYTRAPHARSCGWSAARCG